MTRKVPALRPIGNCVVAGTLVACSASETDPSLWSGSEIGGGNAFVHDGASPDPVPTTGPPPTDASPPPTGTSPVPLPPGPCLLTLDFSTASYGGHYAPRHVEAVWIETAAGQFIQTLEVFGTIRVHNLVIWNERSGGSEVDAVTGATIFSHGAHSVHWDCLDPSGNALPDGDYKMELELTADNSASSFGPPTQRLTIPFYKGLVLDTMVPGTPVFLNPHLIVEGMQ